jgi:hypothetical protein
MTTINKNMFRCSCCDQNVISKKVVFIKWDYVINKDAEVRVCDDCNLKIKESGFDSVMPYLKHLEN